MLADKPYYLLKAFFLLLVKPLAGLIEDQDFKPEWKRAFVWCCKNRETYSGQGKETAFGRE